MISLRKIRQQLPWIDILTKNTGGWGSIPFSNSPNSRRRGSEQLKLFSSRNRDTRVTRRSWVHDQRQPSGTNRNQRRIGACPGDRSGNVAPSVVSHRMIMNRHRIRPTYRVGSRTDNPGSISAARGAADLDPVKIADKTRGCRIPHNAKHLITRRECNWGGKRSVGLPTTCIGYRQLSGYFCSSRTFKMERSAGAVSRNSNGRCKWAASRSNCVILPLGWVDPPHIISITGRGCCRISRLLQADSLCCAIGSALVHSVQNVVRHALAAQVVVCCFYDTRQRNRRPEVWPTRVATGVHRE